MTVTVPAPIKKDPKRANNWKTKALADLTDEDILAMPDSEYMNDVQVAFFRARGNIWVLDCAGDQMAVGYENGHVLNLSAVLLMQRARGHK